MSKELVFYESVQGALKAAMWVGAGHYPKKWLLDYEWALEHMSKEKIDEENRKKIEKWNDARPLGGRSGDIICLWYDLEYGDISEKVPSSKRNDSLKLYLNAASKVFDRMNDDSWVDSVMERNESNLAALINAMDQKESIRIWYSENPNEMNSFYWIMNFLDSYSYYQDVSAIFLPPSYWDGDSTCNSWSCLEIEQWHKILKYERKIDEKEIHYYSEKWERLKKENAPLRLVINGKLTSLSEEIIDDCIFRVIHRMPEEFGIARLLGEMMYELSVSEGIIFTRLMGLINTGKIKYVNGWNDDKPSSTLLRLG